MCLPETGLDGHLLISPVGLMARRLHLPDRDDGHELRRQRVEEQHRGKGRHRDEDLRGSWRVLAPAVRQLFVRQRGHDDEEALEPHARRDREGHEHHASDRSQFLDSRTVTGMTKLQTTIVQKSGEYDPFCVTRNVFTSAS